MQPVRDARRTAAASAALSASKDGDYLPHALDDGTIGYTRWEYQRAGLGQHPVAVDDPPRRHGRRCLVQAAFQRTLVPGRRPLDPRRERGWWPSPAGHHTLAAGPVVVITAIAA